MGRAEMSDQFENFWKAYPHKVGKKAAEKKYWIVRRDVSHETIMEGLAKYKESKEDWRAWCNPTTWLNQGRWEDEPATSRPVNGAENFVPRPMPQYLRQRKEDRPEETEEQKRRKRARIEALEQMRREGLEPFECPPQELRRRMDAILALDCKAEARRRQEVENG